MKKFIAFIIVSAIVSIFYFSTRGRDPLHTGANPSPLENQLSMREGALVEAEEPSVLPHRSEDQAPAPSEASQSGSLLGKGESDSENTALAHPVEQATLASERDSLKKLERELTALNETFNETGNKEHRIRYENGMGELVGMNVETVTLTNDGGEFEYTSFTFEPAGACYKTTLPKREYPALYELHAEIKQLEATIQAKKAALLASPK